MSIVIFLNITIIIFFFLSLFYWLILIIIIIMNLCYCANNIKCFIMFCIAIFICLFLFLLLWQGKNCDDTILGCMTFNLYVLTLSGSILVLQVKTKLVVVHFWTTHLCCPAYNNLLSTSPMLLPFILCIFLQCYCWFTNLILVYMYKYVCIYIYMYLFTN